MEKCIDNMHTHRPAKSISESKDSNMKPLPWAQIKTVENENKSGRASLDSHSTFRSYLNWSPRCNHWSLVRHCICRINISNINWTIRSLFRIHYLFIVRISGVSDAQQLAVDWFREIHLIFFLFYLSHFDRSESAINPFFHCQFSSDRRAHTHTQWNQRSVSAGVSQNRNR